LLAEFLGAFVLLFFGGLAILASGGDLVVISFGFGLACSPACMRSGRSLVATSTLR
jgi:glycerol uptake facilitator-like aquaporin